MRKILTLATMLLAACMACMAQTEVPSIDRHDYLQIDTMWTDYPATTDFRFLKLAGRDSSLSLYDTRRHWLSPKMWHVQDPEYAWVNYLCDNSTTSLFVVYNAQPGENWLVTLSGDKVVLPSYTAIEHTAGNMLVLSYGGDRFFANPDGYASLKTKARILTSKVDALTPWEREDSLGSVRYTIEWPHDSTPLAQNVRQWISQELTWSNPYATEEQATTDSVGVLYDLKPLVIDATMATDSTQVLQVHTDMFMQGVRRDSLPAGIGCSTALTVVRRWAAEHTVTYLADASWYGGGAHGMYTFSYATFDIATGRQLEWTDILTDDSHERVSAMIAAEIDRQRQESGYDAAPQGLTWLNPDETPLCNTNVALLPSGVVFCYQPYDIGSYAEGNYIVVLPYSRLAGMLKATP